MPPQQQAPGPAVRPRKTKASLDSRHKDIFIATVAHELRNMIGPLDSALEILDRARGNAEVFDRALPVARRQMRHMTHLVDELLDFGRIVNDQLLLEREPVDFQRLLEEALAASEPMFLKRLQVVSFVRPGESLWIHGDPVRWAQIATNLLHNAAKFTPPGGSVRVELRTVRRCAELRVTDSGCGIEIDELEAIFGLFKQGGHANGAPAGLGIGLALVRKLVELHGGSIHAESDGPGQGATFVVQVPLLRQRPARPRRLTRP